MENQLGIEKRTKKELSDDIKNHLNMEFGSEVTDKLLDPEGPAFPLIESLNRMTRYLGSKSNQLGDKYFRYISDSLGFQPIRPNAPKVPMSFQIDKGYDSAVLPQGTGIGSPNDKNIHFETSEDLIVRGTKIEKVIVENHFTGKKWEVDGVEGNIIEPIGLESSRSKTDIVYSQLVDLPEPFKEKSRYLLEFTELPMKRGRRKKNVVDDLFELGINNDEIQLGTLNEVVDDSILQDIIFGMGIGKDLKDKKADETFSQIILEDGEEIEISLNTALNLIDEEDKKEGQQFKKLNFGKLRVLEFSRPDSVIVDEQKVNVDADDRKFKLNRNASNSIFYGDQRVLSKEGMNISLYLELDLHLRYFKSHTDSNKGVTSEEKNENLLSTTRYNSINFSSYMDDIRFEYFDGLVWKYLDIDKLNVKEKNINKIGSRIIFNIDFLCPHIPLATISGDESRWIRASFSPDSRLMINQIIKAGYQSYTWIAPEIWGNFTNIVAGKAIEDSDFSKNIKVGANSEDNTSNKVDIIKKQVHLYFDIENISLDNIVEWYFSVSPQNRYLADNMKIIWEYLDGGSWAPLKVFDGTLGFKKSGKICLEFKDLASEEERDHRTIRCRVLKGDPESLTEANIVSIYNNVVFANGEKTLADAQYFNGTAEANQELNLAREYFLNAEVYIQEPAVHESEEELALEEEFVKWKEVDNFLDSTPRSRHYVFDYVRGRIRFGDGVKGKVPPNSTKNIKIDEMKVMLPPELEVVSGELTDIKKKTPGIKSAINFFRASGQRLPAEENEFYQNVSKKMRHFDRAVTAEDFEKLVFEASSEIHSSKVYFDRRKGEVKLLVIPETLDDLMTNESLLDQIRKYVQKRSLVENIEVTYPEIKEFSLTLTFSDYPEDEDILHNKIMDALWKFFDPVSGGQEGNGWPIGRDVYKSEVCWAIKDIIGNSLVKLKAKPDLVHNSYIEMGEWEYPIISEIKIVKNEEGKDEL